MRTRLYIAGATVLRIVLVQVHNIYHVIIVGGIRFVQIIRKNKNNNGYENPKPVLPDRSMMKRINSCD